MPIANHSSRQQEKCKHVQSERKSLLARKAWQIKSTVVVGDDVVFRCFLILAYRGPHWPPTVVDNIAARLARFYLSSVKWIGVKCCPEGYLPFVWIHRYLFTPRSSFNVNHFTREVRKDFHAPCISIIFPSTSAKLFCFPFFSVSRIIASVIWLHFSFSGTIIILYNLIAAGTFWWLPPRSREVNAKAKRTEGYLCVRIARSTRRQISYIIGTRKDK